MACTIYAFHPLPQTIEPLGNFYSFLIPVKKEIELNHASVTKKEKVLAQWHIHRHIMQLTTM